MDPDVLQNLMAIFLVSLPINMLEIQILLRRSSFADKKDIQEKTPKGFDHTTVTNVDILLSQLLVRNDS